VLTIYNCLVDLIPFSYLSSLYRNDLAILWIDAHPDIMTPEQFNHAHAMVLGNLMGCGDPDFVDMVPHPVSPTSVLLVGLNGPTQWESERIEKLGISHVGPKEIAALGSKPGLDWLKSTGARHLAIHLDLVYCLINDWCYSFSLSGLSAVCSQAESSPGFACSKRFSPLSIRQSLSR